MAAQVVKLKRSSVPGKIPLITDIALGELAINTFDGKAFFKKDNGTESIVEVGTGAGGGGVGGGFTDPELLSLYNKNNNGNTATFNGTETRFQLRNAAGAIVSITNALRVIISVNGVIQKPNTGTPSTPFEGFYITANASSGYDLVFDTAPATSSDFFGVLGGAFAATAGTSGIKVLDDIKSQFNGALTAFTLKYDTVNYAPQYPNAVIVSVGGVLQVPTSAYSISGSTITFTSAPPTGATFYAVSLEIGTAAQGVTSITASTPLSSTEGITPVISIQDGSTSQKGAVQLEDSTSSTSTTKAATPNSVKSAYDLANAALPNAGGTMTGAITFAGGQTFPGSLATTGGTLTGDITLNAQADVRFADSDSSHWVAFQAPSSVTANVTWTLPATDATVSGHALKSNAAGVLSWGTAGGATGGGGDDVFYENSQNITTDYSITAGKNAMSAGEITIQPGVTVTVGPGQSWVIV